MSETCMSLCPFSDDVLLFSIYSAQYYIYNSYLHSRLRDSNGCTTRTVSLSVYCRSNSLQS